MGGVPLGRIMYTCRRRVLNAAHPSSANRPQAAGAPTCHGLSRSRPIAAILPRIASARSVCLPRFGSKSQQREAALRASRWPATRMARIAQSESRQSRSRPEYTDGMEIHLPSEIAAEIQSDVERGPYRSVDEFVLHAVALLHDQETWLAANRETISEKIEAGWASAQLGHIADENEVRSRLEERKRVWLEQHRSA